MFNRIKSEVPEGGKADASIATVLRAWNENKNGELKQRCPEASTVNSFSCCLPSFASSLGLFKLPVVLYLNP